MSRTSVYNRQYPGKKIEKNAMPTNDALKIVHQYMNNALIGNFMDVRYTSADSLYNARLEILHLLTMCMDHCIRVSNNVDIMHIKNLVNFYMEDHENGNSEALKLVCSFMEAILHQADGYHGFNNYKWSKYGSTQLHNDYPDFDTAHAHSREDTYNSQEYHRIYY